MDSIKRRRLGCKEKELEGCSTAAGDKRMEEKS
jgi:hypothetical protein